ncbi:MAG: hypothetical protein AAB074_23600 [Planctomycetota bacterium]
MGTEPPRAAKVLARVVEILEDLRIPYAIGGSIASAAHGEYRATGDADILIGLRRDHATALYAAMKSEFYVEPEAIEDALVRHASFNVIHSVEIEKVDLFVSADSELDRKQLERAREMPLPGMESRLVRITAPEDIAVRKLAWYRLGREVSDRQWRDVLGVLKVSGAVMDREHLARIAKSAGVDDLLARALREAGLTA